MVLPYTKRLDSPDHMWCLARTCTMKLEIPAPDPLSENTDIPTITAE